MQKQEKNRKPLIIGIIAAVVILVVLLVLLLTQCTGGQGSGSSNPATEDTSDAVPTYQLYWNADRKEYDGKSEAGMSSRMPEEDGYFHVRFILDGEEIILKVADRKLINAIDVQDVMGLEFDEDGIVIKVLNLDDMPLEKVGWQFYVQSAARTMIKLNSSESMNGMEVMLEDLDPNRIWDMSGKSGPIGVVDEAIELDKIMAVQNLAGEITHVFIFERPNYMLTHEGYCEHCKQTVTWSEWVKDTSVPMLSGHYQLQTDVQLKSQASLPEDVKICLDLNGHRIDGNQGGGRAIAMFNPGIALAIMDTSEEQTGVIAAHGKVDQGGVVWVRYGAFYLYSGTLDASDATTQKGGTAVECGNGKFFYMYGGTIIGGTSTYTYNEEKNTYGAGHAGAVSIGGKFVMNGGEIRDGHAESAVIYKDGKISAYQRGFGGNLFLSSTAEFEMNGGTIKNGRAGGAGGNIYADGAATLTINGGTISGGYLYGKGKNGGNMFLGSKTTTDFNGGTIYGGVSYNCGGNVYLNGKFNMNGGYIGGGVCYNFDTRKVKPTESSANMFVVNGKLTMWGGTIAGHVGVTDSKKGDNNQPVISLYGVARIDGSTVNRNLSVSNTNDGTKVIVGNMYKGAKIGVNTTIGIFTEPTKQEYKQYFYSDIEGADILYYQERLALGRLNCICGKSHGETVSETHINGCNGELILWAPWTSTNSIPTTTGNYFLLNDITTKAQTVVNGGNDIKVDLNGKNITLQVQTGSRDGWRLYRADNGAKLAITDTTDKPGTLRTFMPAADAKYTGANFTVTKTVNGESVEVQYTKDDPEGQAYVKSLWEKGNFGMLLWARGGEITLHNAILDGSNLTGAQNGMLVSVGNNVVTDEESGEKTTYVGKLDMYNGTIIGGYTRAKGNINVGNGAVMNLYGGTITGGRANAGGNINVLGTLNMYGGTVTKGIVDRSHEAVDGGLGGNISVDSENNVLGTMNMYGGVVSNGYVKAGQNGGGHGGNIIVYGTLNVTGGEIRGGEASSAGGNIATIGANSLITLDGAKVLDGKAHTGGNIAVNVRSNKGLYLLGNTVISGGHASGTSSTGGGNVAINLWVNTVDQDQIVVIDGATISDGTAAGNAGNLYVRNATTNRIVVDEKTGKEKQDRFEIAVDVTMKSGTISGGMNGVNADGTRGKFNGGSVFMTSKTSFTLENGTITGGDTTDIGGCFYTNGLLTVKGGTISGGTTKGAVAGSSNVAVVNGTLAMSGGVIDGNVAITPTKAGSTKVLLSGKPVIKQNVTGISLNFYNNVQPVIDIDGKLEEGSSVAVNGSGYISTETPETNLKYFSSTSDTIIYYNKCMFIGRAYCICGKSHDTTVSNTHINGCDGTVYAWERWTSTNTIPTRSGNFYLSEDVTTKTQTVVTAGKDIKLDLNGKNITLQVQPTAQDGFRLYRVEDGSKLAITDTTDKPGTLKTVMPGADAVYPGTTTNTKASKYDENGNLVERVYFTEEEMKTAWAKGNSGMLLWVRGGKVDIHNAILDGSNLEGANSGMLVLVGSNTVTNVVVDPDTNVETEEKTYYYGELNMYNGTIKGGYTKASGNISVNYGCTMNMFGGTITGGRAYTGGNIHVAGTLNIHDGLITKGLIDRGEEAVDAGSGGNINIDNSGVVNMLGGAVTDGTAIGGNGGTSGGHAGNIHVYGKLNATGGTISGGETRGGGGNIGTIGSNARIILDGVEVLDGEAGRGGNICVNVRVCRELIITEKTVVSGGKATNGGNVAVSAVNGQGVGRAGEDAMIVRIEGVIKDGTASGSGGNIHISNAVQTDIGDKPAKKQDEIKVTISSTSVTDGKGGNGGGGNIYLYNANTEITDTEILNGTLTRKNAGHADGGNIYASKGTLKLVGCVVDKGTGKSAAATATQYHYARGGNMFVDSAELTIDSTVISNGSTHGTGANGRAYSGNMHLTNTDATICNGSQIIDGTTEREGEGWSPSGNLYIEGSSDVTIVDTEISGGNGISSANNLYLNSKTSTLTLGEGAVVRNTVEGSRVNICYRAGTLNILDGALITNGKGIACRNIGYLAEDDAVFTMTGGRIVGGNTNSDTFKDKDGKANGSGANVCFNTHKNEGEIVFNMTGGQIVGGISNATGANVYTNNPGEFTMSGGTISGGHAAGSGTNGGNLSVGNNSTVVLKGDAEVIDGTADNCGGNVYVNGTLYVQDDVSISGGTAKSYKNMFLVTGDLYMSGGTIDGGVQVTTTENQFKAGDVSDVIFSGNPVITKNNNGLSISSYSNPIKFTEELEEGSEIWINNTGVISDVTVAGNVRFVNHINAPIHNTYFTDDAMVQAGIAAEDKNKLYIGQFHCVCGAEGDVHLGDCGGTKLLWSAWNTTDKLPMETGNWYLTNNVSTPTNNFEGKTGTRRINLDLNGFNIESKNDLTRMYRIYNGGQVYLTLTNTRPESGKIVATQRTSDQGGIVWGGQELKLYNVTVDGSKLTIPETKPNLSGVVLSTSGKMYLYGSTSIVGGTCSRGQSALEIIGTGRLYMDPTVTVDGEIYVGDSAKIVMDGKTDVSNYTVNASGAFTTGNTITDSGKFFKSNTEAEIFLEGSEQFAGHTYCICGKTEHLDTCGGKMLNWRPNRSNSNIANAAGNWYLTRDVNRTENTNLYFNTADLNYNLNLNGKTVQFAPADGKGYRLFRVTDAENIHIGITDLDQTGRPLTTGKIVATITTNGQDGSIFWITKDSHVLNIYGGTFDATNVTMATDKAGTVLKMNKGKVNLYGGTLIGGTTYVAGGTVAIGGSAELNMYGGTIRDGQTAPGDISGGNIYIMDNAVMNMYDGLVSGGKSPGGATDRSNGDIWGGYGGNMLIVGTLNMYGGEIRDGGGRVGTNICLQARDADKEATLNMSGGIIAGGIAMDKRGTGMPKVILSGNPIINKDRTTDDANITKPTTSLAVASGVIIDAKGLTGGEIYVSGSGQFGIAVESNANVALSAFHSETADEIVLHNKAELHFGRTYCLCGASKTEGKAHTDWCDGMHSWVAWDVQNILEDGYYYVANNISNSSQRWIGNDNASEGEVVKVQAVIDLNGNKVSGGRAFRIRNGSLGITDTVGSGIVEGTKTAASGEHSGTILMSSGTTLNLYAGTLTHRDGCLVGEGGVVAIPANSTVNVYGGTITGGNATNGGNVFVRENGTFNLVSGTVTGGTAVKGGNIYVEDGGTVNISGENAKVEYGLAKSTTGSGYGGNVYIAGGTVSLVDGATVAYGSVSTKAEGWAPGGNIYVNSGELDVTNATISNGQNVADAQSNTDGNNLYINYGAEVNLNAGAVVENNFDASESILIQGGTLTLNGGKIYNAEGVNAADGIVSNSSWKTHHPDNSDFWPKILIESGEIYGHKTNMIISGGTTVTQNGGSVYSPAQRNVVLQGRATGTKNETTYTGDAVYNMNGGKVYGGTVSGNGGNFYLNGTYAQLNVSGTAEIYGGTANEGSGGNIYVVENKNATVTIGGNAKVYDGTNTSVKTSGKPNGGSIWVGKTNTLTLKDNAEVYGGQTCNGGGNIYNNGTVIVQDSVKIYDAKITSASANIFNVGGTLDIKGGSIAGGVRVHSGTIKLSGAPVINKALTTNGKVPASSLSLNNGAEEDPVYMDLSGLTGGEIYVTGTENKQIAKNANSVTLLNYVKSEVSYGGLPVEIDWIEDSKILWLGIAENIYCTCGASYKDNTYTCQCGGAERVWVQWTDKYTLPTAKGNYYLAYDVNLTADTIPVPAKDAEIVIDLRGNNIFLDGNEDLYDFVSNGNAKVIITDSTSDPTQVGSVIATGETTADGGIIYLDGGNTFELYRATLDASGLTGGNGVQGGVAFVSANATLTIHSGTVKGASCHEGGAFFLYNANAKLIMEDGIITGGKASIGTGGNVVVFGGQFTMNGGTISDGQGLKGAGNIFVSGAGQFTMNDGTISGGKSLIYEGNSGVTSDAGGNIRVTGDSVFTMNGGLIKGGVVTKDGATSDSANMFVQNSAMVMTGGTIWGGVAIQNHNATADNIPSLTLSDAAVIDGRLNEDAEGNQLVQKSVSLWGISGAYAARIIEGEDKLQPGACIGLNGTDTLFPGSVSEESKQYFFADNASQNLYVINQDILDGCDNHTFTDDDIGKLYIGQIHCVCGQTEHVAGLCDSTLHVWTGKQSVPYANDGYNYYYLTQDVIQNCNGGANGNNEHLYLDMNGFNIESTSVGATTTAGETTTAIRLINIRNAEGASVNLVNTCSKASTVTLTGTRDQGAIAWQLSSKNSTFRLFNVNVKSEMTATKTFNGGVIDVGGTGNTVWLHSVNFTGNPNGSGYNNEFMSVNTIATLINCRISGSNGNNAAIRLAGQSIRLENCSITGNVGGGVLVERGTLTLAGNTTITGNTSDGTASKNVFVTNGMDGTTQKYGYVVLADDYSGRFGLSGDEGRNLVNSITTWDNAIFTSGKITLDDSTNQQFMIWDNGLGLTGSENIIQCACGGKAAGVGDHQCKKLVFIPWTDTKTLPTTPNNYYLTDDVDIGSTACAFNQSGVINIDLHDHNVNANASRVFTTYIANNSTWSLTLGITNSGSTEGKGVISNTKQNSQDGAMIWMTSDNHVFNLYAGTLDSSAVTTTTDKDSAGVKVARGKFYMYGGTIKGGSVTTKGKGGGSVTLNNSATFDMYAGTISGGNASNGGNIYLTGTSVFTLHNGTITLGRAGSVANGEGTGANIYTAAGTTFEMRNGTISDGATITTNGSFNYNNRAACADIRGNFIMTGGRLVGSVYLRDTCVAQISGNSIITDWQGISINESLSGSFASITFKDLGADAKFKIYVDSEDEKDASKSFEMRTKFNSSTGVSFANVENAKEEDAAKFTGGNANSGVPKLIDGKLYID